MVLLHVALYALHHLGAGVGVHEVHGAYADGSGPGQQEFDGILGAPDSAHADDRNLHRCGRLVDHAHGHRLDGGAAHAAGPVGQGEGALMDVYLHARDGVDQGDRVRPGRLRCPGHLGDVGDIGAELHDDGLSGVPFNFPRDIEQGVRFLAEGDRALLDVGAGYVDFQHVCLFIRKPLHHFKIILHAFSADIYNNFCIKFF